MLESVKEGTELIFLWSADVSPAMENKQISLLLNLAINIGIRNQHSLRVLNKKIQFAILYYSLRRRCNNVAQRRKPWENDDCVKIISPRRAATLKTGAFGACALRGQAEAPDVIMRIADRASACPIPETKIVHASFDKLRTGKHVPT
ncbi:MAG: hypothetical protein WAX69_12120 [Victivallales bacterium]